MLWQGKVLLYLGQMKKLNAFKNLLGRHIYQIAWVVLVCSVVASVVVRVPFGFFDEQVHYVRAVGIANGQPLSYSKNGDNAVFGHDITQQDVRYIQDHAHNLVEKQYVSTAWLSDEVGRESSGSQEASVYDVNTSAAPYTPVAYLPQAFAAFAAQVAGVSMDIKFIMMRLLGAAASLGIVFLAFKVMPRKYRWTLMTIALLPMSVAAFAAISIDGITIAAALLFMAILLKFVAAIRMQSVRRRHLAALAASSVLLIAVKMPAFLLIALIPVVSLLFWNKLTKRQKISLFGIVVAAAIMTLLWALYAKSINTGAFWGKDVDTIQQLQFIFAHPLTYVANLVYEMASFNYADMTYNLYANESKYTNLPFLVDIMLMLGIALSAFVDRRDIKRPSRQDVYLYWSQVGLFVLTTCAIFTLLYLQFTPIATREGIDGVQPRYFLPFVALLVMSPHGMRLSEGWRVFVAVVPFVGVGVYFVDILRQLI